MGHFAAQLLALDLVLVLLWDGDINELSVVLRVWEGNVGALHHGGGKVDVHALGTQRRVHSIAHVNGHRGAGATDVHLHLLAASHLDL